MTASVTGDVEGSSRVLWRLLSQNIKRLFEEQCVSSPSPLCHLTLHSVALLGGRKVTVCSFTAAIVARAHTHTHPRCWYTGFRSPSV